MTDKSQKRTLKESLKFYSKSSLKGVATGFIVFGFSHPIEFVKTFLQANLHYKNSSIKAIKDNFLKGGILIFYSGALPNLIKYSIRNLYRWPMMLFFPKLYNKVVSSTYSKLLTAFTIANIECIIINPLERLKTYLMTKEKFESKAIRNFLVSNEETKINELYRGLYIFILRQNLSWFSFLYFDHTFKTLLLKRRKRNGLSDNLNKFDLGLTSLAVALANTFFVQPLDYVKTNFQKENCRKNEKIIPFMKNTVKEKGIYVLYSGWQVKMTYYLIQSIFYVNLFYNLERENQKSFN